MRSNKFGKKDSFLQRYASNDRINMLQITLLFFLDSAFFRILQIVLVITSNQLHARILLDRKNAIFLYCRMFCNNPKKSKKVLRGAWHFDAVAEGAAYY